MHAQARYVLGDYYSKVKEDNPKALAVLSEIDSLLFEMEYDNLKLKLRTHRLIKDILLLDNRIEDAAVHIQEIEKINYRLTHWFRGSERITNSKTIFFNLFSSIFQNEIYLTSHFGQDGIFQNVKY